LSFGWCCFQGHAGSSVLLNMLTTADFNAQIDILPALAPIADFISKGMIFF
jgi:hypothetical protein